MNFILRFTKAKNIIELRHFSFPTVMNFSIKATVQLELSTFISQA